MDGFEKEKVGNILWSSLVCNQVIIEPHEYGFILIANVILTHKLIHLKSATFICITIVPA